MVLSQYKLVNKIAFLAGNHIRNGTISRRICEGSEAFGMFRKVSNAIALSENLAALGWGVTGNPLPLVDPHGGGRAESPS